MVGKLGFGFGVTRRGRRQSAGGGATIPAAFTAGQWSVTDATTGGQATVTITALPANGGSAITVLQYRIDGGPWLDLVGTGTGARTIGGFTDGIAAVVNIRAVNAVNPDPNNASDNKGVTTTLAPTAPAAFTAAMWDVLNAASGGSATFNILVLPADGNSPITALQYRIGAGAWTSFGATTTGSYTVGGFTDGVATNVQIRAVNTVNPDPNNASDTKTVTATPAPLDRVVDFVVGGSDRLEQDFAWADAGGALPATGGLWLMGFAYYDGVNWSGSVMSAGDPARADAFIELNVNQGVVRNTGQVFTTALSAPATPGWYLCTVWARRLNATQFDRCTHFRNEVTTVANGTVTASITTWPRLALGARVQTAPANHANFEAAGFAAGWGDPTALHAWLYNGGAFGRDIRDYPGDAGVIVRHYWVGARAGGAAFSASDPALVDVIGAADTWTQVGSPVWTAISPPFFAGVVTSSVTSAVVPAGATNTLVLTSTIPTGDWGGVPVVDTAKIDIAVRRGMGPVNITGVNVVTAGLTATTTLTLDRPVYASEIARCNLDTNWLTVPNRMQSNSYASDITNNSPTADPANWPGISHGSTWGAIGWRFATPVPAGYHADGIPWCAPCTIADEYPARSGGLHGAEQNPARRLTGHRFDSRAPNYSGAPVALPWTLADKDTVIKTRSNPFPNSANEGSASQPQYIVSYGGLVCRASAPAANEFAPPLVWATPATRPSGPTLDVATLSFPTYSTAGHSRPTAANIIPRVQIFDPSISIFDAVDPQRRQMHPTGITMSGGYPEVISGFTQAAGLILIGDDTLASKREVARGMIMHGTQWYGPIEASSTLKLECDGGQASGFLLPMALTLCWTGLSNRLATFETDIGTNELQQSFLITAPLLSQMTARDATTPNFHAVGNYEWTVRGVASIPTLYTAGPGAVYRSNNRWTGTLLVLRAFGFLHSSFANFQGVVRRANDQAYPSGTGWPLHHNIVYSGLVTPTSYAWEAAFWNSHRTAIDAVPQTVG